MTNLAVVCVIAASLLSATFAWDLKPPAGEFSLYLSPTLSLPLLKPLKLSRYDASY